MQLPSVQLDNIVESDDQLFIVNRNPQPGEVQVPLNAPIDFDLYGSFVDLRVYINDELAFEGDGDDGETSGGWTATVADTPDSAGWRISLRPPIPFASGQHVFIRAQAGSAMGFWSFDAYDLIPPLIASVEPINKDQVRVRFNEPVTMGTLTAGDALLPANYFIERVSMPAATPRVLHVDRVSEREVLLTTEFELSFGARYMLVISDVADEFDNFFLPPENVYEFDGWLPPFPVGRRWLLHDHVPAMALAEDSTDDLKLFLACLQDTNNLLLESVDRWTDILDPDVAPEQFVDAMLLDLGNPFDFEMTLDQKRRLVKCLMLIYRSKGTAKGIADVIRFFMHLEVTFETFVGRGWHLGVDKLSKYGTVATPHPIILGPDQHALYSFRIHVNRILTAGQRSQMLAIATYMKCAHEHLIEIRDASPIIPAVRYWTLGKTKLGFVRLFGNAGPPPSSSLKTITSFTLTD